jgi:hypothetical protein
MIGFRFQIKEVRVDRSDLLRTLDVRPDRGKIRKRSGTGM